MSQSISNIYIIGSLRNKKIPEVGNAIRNLGIEAFDDWYAAGPEADDFWQAYEKTRGNDYRDALKNWAAQNVFDFDRKHLNRVDAGLLVLPAGKSGHLELGYLIGLGKPGYILLDGEPDRYDVMYNFAERVFLSLDEVVAYLALTPEEYVEHEREVTLANPFVWYPHGAQRGS